MVVFYPDPSAICLAGRCVALLRLPAFSEFFSPRACSPRSVCDWPVTLTARLLGCIAAIVAWLDPGLVFGLLAPREHLKNQEAYYTFAWECEFVHLMAFNTLDACRTSLFTLLPCLLALALSHVPGASSLSSTITFDPSDNVPIH